MQNSAPCHHSLNEVESIALKATRGAGYAWGLAEEAAFACRWLAAHGLTWAPALLSVLASAGNLADPATLDKAAAARTRAASSAPVCPLRLGAYLADLGAVAASAASPTRVAGPLLMVPFLAGCPVLIAFDATIEGRPQAQVSIGPSGLHATDDALGALAAMSVATVKIAPAGPLDAPSGTRRMSTEVRSEVRRDLLEVLARYEAMTYVPASTHSRLAGAGAGLDDND
jgi:hypothetical protein